MLTGIIRFYEHNTEEVNSNLTEIFYTDVHFALHINEDFKSVLRFAVSKANALFEKYVETSSADLSNYKCLTLYADMDELDRIYQFLPDSLKFKTRFFEVTGDTADNIFRNCLYYNWNRK